MSFINKNIVLMGALIATSFLVVTHITRPSKISNVLTSGEIVHNSSPNSSIHAQHQGMMDHSNMDLGPGDAYYDLRFIDAMIPHHEGAVIMAKKALENSKRSQVRNLANNIIKAQDQEITQMEKWRKAWYPDVAAVPQAWHSQMNHMMPMSSQQIKAMQMDVDLGVANAEFDLRFIDAMIPHHEGALIMAEDLLKKSQRPEMLQLARNILASQQKEIEQMKQWRKAWYGK